MFLFHDKQSSIQFHFQARLFWLFFGICVASALDGDLALGEWRLLLKSNQFDAIFPESSCVSDSTQRRKRNRLWGKPQSHDCRLLVFANGTFALSDNGPDEVPLDPSGSKAGTSQRLQIHGRWHAPNNPYCATDRFYQSICLESYPRRQYLANDSSAVLQRNQLMLYGRLVGHFQQGRRRSSQAVGRITHGKIIQQNLMPADDTETNPWWRIRRPVLASFVAKQIKIFEEEDENEPEDYY